MKVQSTLIIPPDEDYLHKCTICQKICDCTVKNVDKLIADPNYYFRLRYRIQPQDCKCTHYCLEKTQQT